MGRLREERFGFLNSNRFQGTAKAKPIGLEKRQIKEEKFEGPDK